MQIRQPCKNRGADDERQIKSTATNRSSAILIIARTTLFLVALLAPAETFWGTLGAWVSGGPEVPVVRTMLSNANLAPATVGFSSTLTVRESPDVLTA